jgi:hypothetical protein
LCPGSCLLTIFHRFSHLYLFDRTQLFDIKGKETMTLTSPWLSTELGSSLDHDLTSSSVSGAPPPVRTRDTFSLVLSH